MMRLGRGLLIFAMLLTIMILSGCWDRREINDVAFVAASAADKEGEGYRVGVQIPLPGQMGGPEGGGGGTSGDKSWYLDSEKDKTLRGALEKLQQRLSRVLNFSHRRVVVFGEELSKEGLVPVIDILIRAPQNRLTVFPIIAEGKALDLLNAKTPVEQLPSEMIRELASLSFSKLLLLNVFMKDLLKEGEDPILPVMKMVETKPGAQGQKEEAIQMAGVGVMKRDRLVSIFRGEDAKNLLWLNKMNRLPTVTLDYPEERGYIILQFQQSQVDVRPVIQGDEVSFQVKIKAKGSVMEDTLTKNIVNGRAVRQLEQDAEEKVEEAMKQVISQLKELKADPLGFGSRVRDQDFSFWRKHKNDWLDIYGRSDVFFEIEFNIEHTGTVSNSIIRKHIEVKS
ncbi:Ger(x)C family spore germination protein [Paenibacillus tarimensis]|uniref:Ger(x)C family spore germination protein n=2 Tax=Paenibacillus tarimensis TaxID=416012 RepID=UPI0039EF20B7